MKPAVFENYQTLSRAAADMLLDIVQEKPKAVIIIATGSTPTRAYQLWVHDLLEQKIPTDQVTIIKLDEWGGLPMHHPSTCETYIRQYIIEPLHLRENQFISFNSQPENPQIECERIAGEIGCLKQIDVCVLGIGINGHLGFNEPSDRWSIKPFVTQLTTESLNHEMLHGTASQVSFGLTLGIENIKKAKKILVLANGSAKADVVATALFGPVTPHCPASILQTLNHAYVFLDEDAAKKN